jgi:hypothetical protein
MRVPSLGKTRGLPARAAGAHRRAVASGLGPEMYDAIAGGAGASPYSTLEVLNLGAALEWDLAKVRTIVDAAATAGISMPSVLAIRAGAKPHR